MTSDVTRHKNLDLSFLVYQYVWSAFIFGSAALMVTILPFIFIFNSPGINPLWVGFGTVACWTLAVLGYMIAFGLLQEAWHIWKLYRFKKFMLTNINSETSNSIKQYAFTDPSVEEETAEVKTILSSVINFSLSDSSTSIPTTGWGPSVPACGESGYLWTRTYIIYSDFSTATYYTYRNLESTEDDLSLI